MNQEVIQDRDLLAATEGGLADLAPVISELLHAGDKKAILAHLEDQHPADIASLVEALPTTDASTLLNVLPISERADVFGYLGPENQIEIARTLGRRELAKIVAEATDTPVIAANIAFACTVATPSPALMRRMNLSATSNVSRPTPDIDTRSPRSTKSGTTEKRSSRTESFAAAATIRPATSGDRRMATQMNETRASAMPICMPT